MKGAREAILMSKLGKKKVPSAKTGPIGGEIGTANSVAETPFVSADTMKAKELIGASKLKGGFSDSANSMGKFVKPEYEAQVEFGPTETQGYSPVNDYLKKRKGK